LLRPKPRRQIGAVVMADFETLSLETLFEPLIEKLAPGLSKAAANAFRAVIADWVSEVHRHQIGFAADDLSNIGESAISLHRQLTVLQELFSKIRAADQRPGVLEEVRATYGGDLVVGRLFLLSLVDQAMQNGTPPLLNVEGLCSVLSKIIERVKDLGPAKRAPGKPLGIKNYPALHFLVFYLAIWAVNNLPAPFTAYVKRAGVTEIAVGSLIDTLNLLREYLVNDQVVNKHLGFLASYLPKASEHSRCVSSYQRALRAAWEEVELEKAAPTTTP
jgi:hypothetical protein